MSETGAPEQDGRSSRAAFRAFVRANHPDAGGDPDTFVAGLAWYRRKEERSEPVSPVEDEARFDAPVTFVRSPKGVSGRVRAWRRRRRRPRRVQ